DEHVHVVKSLRTDGEIVRVALYRDARYLAVFIKSLFRDTHDGSAVKLGGNDDFFLFARIFEHGGLSARERIDKAVRLFMRHVKPAHDDERDRNGYHRDYQNRRHDYHGLLPCA